MPEHNSSLNSIIFPEIKNDAFYNYIQTLAQDENIKYILEIGSSSGEGSTEAFVKGIRKNPSKPTLFCMEVSQVRFEKLRQNYEHDNFVKFYNVSSVALEQFPSEQDIIDFYNNQQSGLNFYPLDQVLGWLKQDIEYIKTSQVQTDGIQKIKQANNIDFFDVVLIDGSEFTGKQELEQVYGAKYLLLDDINTFKNHENFQILSQDNNYSLIGKNDTVRNGYAIFKKNSVQPVHYRTIKPAVEAVEGFMLPGQEEYLFNKVKSLPSDAVIVEIGSYKGRSTVAMAYACIGTNRKIYCIDTWDGNDIDFPDRNFFDIWQNNVKNNGLYEYVVPCRGYSHQVLSQWEQLCGGKEIDFIFIDGSHQFLDVLKDFELSFPLIKESGWIAFHDVIDTWPGSERVWHHIAKYRLINHEYSTSLACGQKNSIVFSSSLLQDLPIHFFTIVLNGEPFIRYHIDVFNKLSFKWHWHIIEGVADLKHDTSWSLKLGGKLTDQFHKRGRSKDGTSEYLDQLAQEYPDNITIYRKPEGIFWDGKREMVNAPLPNIQEECLLWQIDVDELWTVEQMYIARQMFINHPEKTAAFYWCWYFVGEKLVISTRNCYTQNPQQEWLRTWRFKPGYVWAAHEPPILVEILSDHQKKNIASVNPFLHGETEKQGLVFQHFAYVTPEQLQFKEQYYGYRNAVLEWQNLQSATQFPVLLRNYFSWVQDQTRVDMAEACGIIPIAQKQAKTDSWEFVPLTQLNQPRNQEQELPKILVDGVFFQLYKTGIARMWESLWKEWQKNGFSRHILVLDRDGTAPKISGLWYRTVPAYDYGNTDADRQMLQQICDEEGADLFISTYYTTPLSTPSVFMAYDMIPEVLGANINEPMWREKHRGILHASAYIAISENTATDLVKYFPEINSSVTVAHCGISSDFYPAPPGEIIHFKTKYGINKPYFLLVGAGSGYKNAVLFFQGFSQLYSKSGFDVICTGAGYLLGHQYRELASGSIVHSLYLSDEELRAAYSGATALVYPSKYEGFGMPIAEALACGCPVITCPNASIPEVAWDAAIYVKDDHIEGMVDALCEVQKLKVRNDLRAKALEQAQKFSWSNMADLVSSALMNATLLRFNFRDINLVMFPDWSQPEEILYPELASMIKALATHPNRSEMTLLIDHHPLLNEDADLALSSVMMNLLMEEELELDDSVEIALLGQLNSTQWSALRSRLQGRIVLEHENQEAIANLNAETIPVYDLEKI